MKKKVVELCGFIIILSILMTEVCSALTFKYGDGILGLKYLYEQNADSVDVLVLGSSHAFEDINTQVLYDEFGVASYVLAGSVQPFWNSYYYLQEALKTQTPKLVILEGFAATKDYEYSDHSRIVKNNLGIKNRLLRLESLSVSSPKEDMEDYIFEWRLWHSRYEELGAGDFDNYYQKPLYLYYKGFGINFATTSYEMPNVETFEGEAPIYEKQEKYYRKIIELCKQKEIPVMVVVSPYILSESEQQKYNYLERITKEYGVDFVNYNSEMFYDWMGLDFSSDFADADHLNNKGNVKYTRVLGEYITNQIELPDRRGDLAYLSWELHSKDILERTRDKEIAGATTVPDFLESYGEGEDLVTYVYTISNTLPISDQTDIFEKFNIAKGDLKDGSLYEVVDTREVEIVGSGAQWEYVQEYDDVYFQLGKSISVENDKLVIDEVMMVDGKEFINDGCGAYVLVYNQFTKSLVCVKQIKIDANGEVVLITK